MTVMKFNKEEEQTETIIFPQNIYSIKAIKRSAYDLSNKANITITCEIDGKYKVNISPNQDELLLIKELAKEFNQLVLDHQVLLEVEKDYGAIRKLIVAQAFHPCDNLSDLINQLENENII